MSRIAYVNGRYVPHRNAAVHIEDRGYQFADGVYEVCAVLDGELFDAPAHLDRFARSLAALEIAWPMSRAALMIVILEVIRRNRLHHGIVYFQVTRGVAPRDHAFPKTAVRPSLVVTAKHLNPQALERRCRDGVAVVTMADERWAHPHIKSISLLPNVLAKQAAKRQGADEAWLVDRDGFVTEGASTNAWIVTKAGTIVTRPADGSILDGITRQCLLRTAHHLNLPLEERAFTVAEAIQAQEAFMSASSSFAVPVISIDGQAIGSGKAGPVATQLRDQARHFAHRRAV